MSLFDEVAQAMQRHLGYKFEAVNSEAEAYYGTSDPQQLVEIVHNDLINLFKGGHAKLYRVVNVPDEIIAKLGKGANLGPVDDASKPSSWTTDPSNLEFSALRIDAIHDYLENYFMFTAAVRLSAVDIPLTIAQNIELHWEKEVALKRNAPIQLISVERVEYYASNPKLVRPDLRGAVMRS
jgi:hypothetical protein